MLKLLKYLRKRDRIFAAFAFVLIACQVWLELKMPDFMSKITQLVQTEGSEMSEIVRYGEYMLLCALGSLVSAVSVGYLISSIAASFSLRVRKRVFQKVGELDMNGVKKFSISSLITRSTNDITQIQMLFAMGGQMLVRAPLSAAWALTKILNKNAQWTIVTGIGVGVLLVSAVIIMSLVLPRFKIIQKLTDRLNGVTRENLTGIRVVRAFNAEKYQEDKFKKANDDLTETQLFTQRALSMISPLMYLIMEGISLAIYFVGAYMINGAALGDKIVLFGDMIVFSSYALHVIVSFLMLAMIFSMLPRAQVSAERINEVLKEKITILDGDFNIKNLKEHGTVEFKNVSFKYPDAEESMLDGISFKANKGDTIAFIGSTGSGKSTLINLIPRLYDVTEGQVLVDGVDVREYKQTDLRNLLGYVSQKAVLFDGTVQSNVAYGKSAQKSPNEKKLKDAIKVAQAKDFVEKMPQQYKSHIAQGGTNISGGQKQRLSIARAIAREPEIYIFDDSFSALDYRTDAELRAALKKYTNGATSLIVAQRIGTIMHADKIIVLNDGKCVGQGTHAELLKNCEVYQQIAYSQLTKEELNA